MFNIIIGQYVPGQSVIHRLDPRAKLLAVFLFVIIIFLANNWVTYALAIIFTLLGVFLSKVPVRFIYRGLKPIIIIIIFTFILNVLFTKEGELLVSYGWFHIYEGGLIQAVFISMRLLVIIVATTLLTLTTSPIDITDGLEILLGPLKKIKLPVHEFALMMSIALRFIPTLLEETEKVMKAQSARGSDFTSGSLKSRVKAIIPLLVPLFVGAFKRAEELAMAMEARGYRGDVGRTRLRQLIWSLSDTFLMLVTLFLTAALFILRG
ncbi:energy-coupling factor transport system permease protein [Scopulibacillus darangshiensis]|uniref:Energy-coupling factor transporter transmembrane protein EcfT n=1 Tax=Scopulibacillus darangshiensis TaxID=442528 RepID=A0A4R2NQP9_9BACL|nr:energy-coupling factor transporter transmembrane protein EcfT [Scopulibacillus darangshiensis]TCP24193.1 energy-coupling factor transport system permease protein [Scopulibacillus darangshiensis]